MAEQVRAIAPDGLQGIVDFFGRGSLAKSASLLVSGVGREQMVTIADRARAAEIGAHWIGIQPDVNDLAQIVAWVEQGALTIHVGGTLPFADASEAHRRIQSQHSPGKIVLTID